MEDYEKIFNEYKRGERKVPQISMSGFDIMKSSESIFLKELKKIEKEVAEDYVKKYSRKVKDRKILGLLFDSEHTEIYLGITDAIDKSREDYKDKVYKRIPRSKEILYGSPDIYAIDKIMRDLIDYIEKPSYMSLKKDIVTIFEKVEKYNETVNHITRLLPKDLKKEDHFKKLHKTDVATINKCLKNMILNKIKVDLNITKLSEPLQNVVKSVSDTTYKITATLPHIKYDDLCFFDYHIESYVREHNKGKIIKKVEKPNINIPPKLKIYG